MTMIRRQVPRAVGLAILILLALDGYLGTTKKFHLPLDTLMYELVDNDPELTQNQQQAGTAVYRLRQESSIGPSLVQHGIEERTRMSEASALIGQKDAFRLVRPMIQPALGGSNDEDGDSDTISDDLRPLDFSFRRVELTSALRASRILYLITPTYTRQTQMVDMLRLSQTLQLATTKGYHNRMYWIIVEQEMCTQRVRQLAEDSGIPFAHVSARKLNQTENPKKHRGVESRNMGLDVVERIGAEGVVYFMDDDNAYHVQLFHELSYTTHVSVFGVGMVGGGAYERCHVDPVTGKVDDMLTAWKGNRLFPMDMAGFAFATHHLAGARGGVGTLNDDEDAVDDVAPSRDDDSPSRNDDDDDTSRIGVEEDDGFVNSRTRPLTSTRQDEPLRFSLQSNPGYLEDVFLKQMVSTLDELEPLAANCTRILAYHVKTEADSRFGNVERHEGTFELIKALV